MSELDEEQGQPDRSFGPAIDVRPKSSLAQVASTLVQAGLLAVALYGLFISSLGDRLLEVLQGDILSAKEELSSLEQAAAFTETELLSRQAELERTRQDFILSRLDLKLQEEELRDAINSTRRIELDLDDANLRLEQLSSALNLTRPALINQRCKALVTQLIAPRGPEMSYRILPLYRWNTFRIQAQKSDFLDYDTLKSAFENWTVRQIETDPQDREFFKFVDAAILLDLDSQRHWSSFTSQREEEILRGLKVADPADFIFKPSVYRDQLDSIPNFVRLEADLRSGTRLVEALIEKESVEEFDPIYADFKGRIRNQVAPMLPTLNSYIDEGESSVATTTDEITRLALKQLRFERVLRSTRKNVAELCGMENPIDRLFYGV